MSNNDHSTVPRLNLRRSTALSRVFLIAAAVSASLFGAAAAPAFATSITPPGGGESFSINPGDTIQAGYDFTIPGNNQAVTVRWAHPQAVVNFTCSNNKSGSFTIPMPNYTATVSDSNWYPSGDQHDSSVYQGVVTAPNGCGDGSAMHMNQQATFTADVSSSPSDVQLHYRFHNSDNTSGSWSSTNEVTTSPITQTIQGEIYKCVNGAPSTTLINGGTIAVPAASLSSNNPLPATTVPAGSYPMNATAPSGDTFVACGQTGVTINTGTATQTVTVPSGGAGDGKFYVTSNSTPPPSTGYVEICKSKANGVTGNFTFTVASATVTVPAGACSSAIQVPAGTNYVHEKSRAGFTFVTATTAPSSRLVKVNASTATATITVPAGDVSTQTIVTVTNKPVSYGTLKICQVAGSGIATDTEFGFTTSATSGVTDVPAGTGAGYCGVVSSSLVQGSQVTITQSIPSGDAVSSITVGPSGRQVGAADVTHGKVTVTIGSGVTEVTYTDTRSGS